MLFLALVRFSFSRSTVDGRWRAMDGDAQAARGCQWGPSLSLASYRRPQFSQQPLPSKNIVQGAKLLSERQHLLC